MDDASAMAERTDDRSTRTATTRYGADAQAWALEQAALLKAGRFGDLDLIDLAVDVADSGKHATMRPLEGDWSRMLQHLSAWDIVGVRAGSKPTAVWVSEPSKTIVER